MCAGEGVEAAADKAADKAEGAVGAVKGLAAEAADTARATGEEVAGVQRVACCGLTVRARCLEHGGSCTELCYVELEDRAALCAQSVHACKQFCRAVAGGVLPALQLSY